MAKVISHTKEDEVVYMCDPDIEFVSLVKHAANRFPIQITKAEGDTMKRIIQSVLVPKYTSQKKLEELAEQHGLSLSKETKSAKEYEGFNVFKQVEDEKVDLEKRELTVLDEEGGVYGVVAEVKEEDETVEGIDEKQLDWATLDNLTEALFAMSDIVIGALRQPEATDSNRKNTVLSAIDNLRKYAEAVLSNSKSEDVADVTKIDLQKENLQDLLPQPEEKDEPKEPTMKQEDWDQVNKALDEYSKSVVQKSDEKAQEKIDAYKEEVKSSFEELDQNLQTKFDSVASTEKMEELEEKITSLQESLDELTKTAKRKSETPEGSEPESKETKEPKQKSPGRFITMA